MKTLLSLCAVFLFTSCSVKKDKTKAEGNASLTIAETETGKEEREDFVDFAATCTKDAETGVVNIKIDELEIRVKGFQSSASYYVCKQATDNRTTTTLGQKYDSCGVIFQVRRDEVINDVATARYATFRDNNEVGAFSYAGSCAITFIDVADKLSGTLICRGMPMTHQNSIALTTVDTAKSADITGSFNCPVTEKEDK